MEHVAYEPGDIVRAPEYRVEEGEVVSANLSNSPPYGVKFPGERILYFTARALTMVRPKQPKKTLTL